jgi:hypothetical protein
VLPKIAAASAARSPPSTAYPPTGRKRDEAERQHHRDEDECRGYAGPDLAGELERVARGGDAMGVMDRFGHASR